MSENIGKLLFDCAHGWAWFRGVVESETEKTFTVRQSERGRANRRHKAPTDILIRADADPKAAEKRFSLAYANFSEEVKAAEDALTAVRKRQKLAAISALVGLPQ